MLRLTAVAPALVVTLVLAVVPTTMAFAQPAPPATYELTSASSFTTGCQGPSGCICQVFNIGAVQGTFDLQELFPPLLPIRDFAVSNVQWTIAPGTPNAVSVTGSGVYHVDISTGMHLMTLDLVVNGTAQQFTSTGFVPGGATFMGALTIDLFAQLDMCMYDGFLLEATRLPANSRFIRGECNLDGMFNIADPVFLLGALFPQGSPPVLDCADACDANDDGTLNIADAVTALATLFPQGPPIPLPPPFPGCGNDPTADALTCLANEPCCTGTAPVLQTLAQGELGGLGPQATIIRDDPTWQSVWAQISSLPAPPVDFTVDMVIVVARVFNTSGSSVQIDSLCYTGSEVEIHFTTSICLGPLPVAISPYQIVSAPMNTGAAVPVENVTMVCP